MEENEKTCNNCGIKIEKFYYSGILNEEWIWDGKMWECYGRNSLIDDPKMPVHCAECDAIIGTGRDFGF